MSGVVVVVGGGVAGCAAAVAASGSGADVVLIEARRHLGGVAAQGEHRTLAGLAPIDAPHAELLEPGLTADWVGALATGEPYRQGLVWLWPTAADALQAGLQRRLANNRVTVRLGADLDGVVVREARVVAVTVAGMPLPVRALIDASGCGLVAHLLGVPTAPAEHWGAHRSMLRLPGLGPGLAARASALLRAQRATGGTAAIALTPLGGDWQLSLDLSPGSNAATAAVLAQRVAEALDGELLACAVAVAERDAGRPCAGLDLDALFATRARGLCWAAWPREAHGEAGVAWTWPPHDRHGIPPEATQPDWAPRNLWLAGKALAVTAEAAAALRVTGTGLAVGGAVGRLAASA